MSTVTSDRRGGPGEDVRTVDLAIGGMTCASCAARIEKKLNKLDGVTATVNFATEKARVSVPATVSEDELVSVVERTGYRASPTGTPPAPGAVSAGDGVAGAAGAGDGAERVGRRDEAEPDEAARLRRRLLVSLVLAVPVRWEPGQADDSTGPWFPHVYGPLPRAAVVGVHSFPPQDDGSFRLPASLAER